MTSNGASQKVDAYPASVSEEKINAYKGVMPVSEQRTLAQNLGELLELAREKGIRKGHIVVAADIPHPEAAPVNVLGNYCILPNTKNKRRAPPRLCAHPQPYLQLAIAAANLMDMHRHDAIVKLTEGSNLFGAQNKIDDQVFSPIQTVWGLLKARIAVIAERHELKKYFRDVHMVSATFDENILQPGCWEQGSPSFGQSASCWPTVYLCAVVRSSTPARFNVEDTAEEEDGLVHVIEQVSLTLGWHTAGWIIGYLECLPGLAFESLGKADRPTLFNLRCSGETFTRGSIGNIKFEIENEGSIKVPAGGGDWPYRLRSRRRFESLTPQQLASTLLDGRFINTPDQTLFEDIDTTSVLVPPNTPLALMEAQLLGRKYRWPNRGMPTFLDKLEEEIVYLQTSFRKWRLAQLEMARTDHVEALISAAAEMENLRRANEPVAAK